MGQATFAPQIFTNAAGQTMPYQLLKPATLAATGNKRYPLVLFFHGAGERGSDTTVKVIRTRHMIEAMQQAGGHPKYTEYTGLGHNSWDKAYSEPDLLSWMFAQDLEQRVAPGKSSPHPAPQPE